MLTSLDARGKPFPGSGPMYRSVTVVIPDALADWLEAYLAQPGSVSLSGLLRLALVAELGRRCPEGEP